MSQGIIKTKEERRFYQLLVHEKATEGSTGKKAAKYETPKQLKLKEK